jgi:hypothetical protein
MEGVVGTTLGGGGVAHDITERKAEEELGKQGFGHAFDNLRLAGFSGNVGDPRRFAGCAGARQRAKLPPRNR